MSDLRALVEAIRSAPGLLAKRDLPIVEHFDVDGDDAALVEHGDGFLVMCGEAISPPFLAADPYGARIGRAARRHAARGLRDRRRYTSATRSFFTALHDRTPEQLHDDGEALVEAEPEHAEAVAWAFTRRGLACAPCGELDRTRVLRLRLCGAEAPVWDLARTPLTGLGPAGSPSAGP